MKIKRLPRRFNHFIYGGIQSGLTTAVATGIANLDYLENELFLARWTKAWLVSWILMLPVVILAAPPLIRRATLFFVQDES